MNTIIRQAKENEYDDIYELVKVAFETAPFTDEDEQNYVVNLRASGKHIPKLELVAESNNVIIGHIMLTTMNIKSNGKVYEELLLSPLCVVLEHRNKGIGELLTKESFKIAKELGYSSVFVVGDPKYYSRFGFKQATEFGIQNKGDIEEQYVMAHELVKDALKDKERNSGDCIIRE